MCCRKILMVINLCTLVYCFLSVTGWKSCITLQFEPRQYSIIWQHKTQHGQLNSLTCSWSQCWAGSLHHSSTRTQQELCCSTDHTGRGSLFSARLSFVALCIPLPGAAEIHSCSQSRCSLSPHHLLHYSSLRSLHIPPPLFQRGGRNGRPSRGGLPQTAGRTKTSVRWIWSGGVWTC